MHWKTLARLVFALTMIGMGVLGLLGGTFAPIWAGVPRLLPDRQMLSYLCTLVALACGVGLLLPRAANLAARVLVVYLIIWTLAFKVPLIVHQPLVEVSYQSCGENLVLIAAAWVLYIKSDKRRSFPAGDIGLRTAHLLYGFALVAFGFSHFAYLSLTAPLVPKWLQEPVFWAYFTGAAYLAAGVAIVTGVAGRLGAVGSAVQISLITLLVWGPGVLSGKFNASNWQEPAVSWMLVVSAWVVAGTFDHDPWLKPLGFGKSTGRRLARS